MTLEEFHTKLTESSSVPLFYEIITVEKEEDMPTKYLYYVTGETVTFCADNKVKWSSIPIELVIAHGPKGLDDSLKAMVNDLLDEEEIPYRSRDSYNNQLTMWITTYNFRI